MTVWELNTGQSEKPTTVSVAKYDKYFTIFKQLLPKLKSKIAAAELPNHACLAVELPTGSGTRGQHLTSQHTASEMPNKSL